MMGEKIPLWFGAIFLVAGVLGLAKFADPDFVGDKVPYFWTVAGITITGAMIVWSRLRS